MENKTIIPDKKETASITGDAAIIQTAKDAYIYGLPLVLIDITHRQMTNAASTGMHAPINQFKHLSSFPDASFKDVVRPNADTYYSSAWLDLGKDPIILSVPDTKDRYYMMPMLDAYTNVFDSPGKRTTGTAAGNFLITGPRWKGTVPAGMKQIKAPTELIWIIGRTQVNSKEDGAKTVVPIQEQYKLTPLSAWEKSYTPDKGVAYPDAPIGKPNEIVKNMPVDSFFNYVNRLMINNPPADADKPVLERFATIGVAPAGKFDLGLFSTSVQAVIKNLPRELFATFDKEMATPPKLENGWNVMRSEVGTYGINYGKRALISFFGLGANLPQDAIYPTCQIDADGKQLNGSNKYTIHFDKGKMPPANAFWSLTMYDPNGYFVDNPIDRYAIGDRSDLTMNADGSVDIYFQNASPGKEKENNWLPAPTGDFNLLMRVYWPKDEMINGTWQIPSVKKMN